MDMTVEVPELPELTFDEASHIYRLNGDIIPSVSKLMEPLKDQCYGGISKRTLENAAIKGSAVHNSIENWIKFGIDDIPSEHRGYFNGFVEWWKQYKPRVFGSEVRIYHKLMRYGGTIDLLCEIGGLLELIDFKTTYTLLEMACGVQLEAYQQMGPCERWLPRSIRPEGAAALSPGRLGTGRSCEMVDANAGEWMAHAQRAKTTGGARGLDEGLLRSHL